MVAQGTHQKAALEVQQMLTMINDKKRIGHKLSSNETYAEGKIRSWCSESKRQNKPLKDVLEHLVNPIWELVYLWNGITYWDPQVLKDTIQTIQNRLLDENTQVSYNGSDNGPDLDGSHTYNDTSKDNDNKNCKDSNSSDDSTMFLIMGVIERDIRHDHKKAFEYFNRILRKPDEESNWTLPYAMFENAVTHCKQKKECSSLTSTWICRVEDYYLDHPDDIEWHARMQLRCQLLLESQIIKCC
jgi:hypothetical protein